MKTFFQLNRIDRTIVIPAFVLLGFLVLMSFSPKPMNPGVVFQVETTYHSGSPRSESSQMSIEGKNLKMEILPGDSGESGKVKDEAIFRGDRREMVVVDHNDKSYMVIDKEAIGKIKGQVESAKEMMGNIQIPKEVLEQMPEAERKKIEELMKQQGIGKGATGDFAKPKEVFRKTSDRGKKQGYPCVKYEVLQNGEKIRELWVTDWDNIDGGDEAKEAFEELNKFFEELMDSLGDMFGEEGGGFPGSDNQFGDFFETDGFPVVTRSFEGGELEEEHVLRSATRRTLDPADFEPPAGYKRRSMGPQ